MYQFYYADNTGTFEPRKYEKSVREYFEVEAIRPTMWEEHCLECSAPLCYKNCLHYMARSDGRCKRFVNGLQVFLNQSACCGQGVHVSFRKWANMMTIVFPGMISESEYQKLFSVNQILGRFLKVIEKSALPQSMRWQVIRTFEYIRRKKLRQMNRNDNKTDAFIFHGYSYSKERYNLILEIYNDHLPVFKTSLDINPGENLIVLPAAALSGECEKAGNLIKVYPENDKEAELDILWCDFVKGRMKTQNTEQAADKVKLVAWDLDGTLWDAVLIETENTNEIHLKDGIMDIIQELDQRGILQSVASKNDYDVAWPVLEKLGIANYFLYPQIHWNAKSKSMSRIAECLNIGIDSLVLIDDTVFERKEVQSAYPQVRTYDVSELPQLLEKSEFIVPVTEESKMRRAMYKAEQKRNELKSNDDGDLVGFLRKCNLKVSIFVPLKESDLLRCYELIVRTNQLNMSGKKYKQQEFEDVLHCKGHKYFACSCKDDFGEYGIIAFGQYRIENSILIFTEFAMSCRVAGKYVESAVFAYLLHQEKCDSGIFTVVKTKKNSLLRSTLENIGFEKQVEQENTVQYVFTEKLKHTDLVEVL